LCFIEVGWRAEVSPADHAVSQYEFDVLIGADGKRNTLEGFGRKEFRGKLAIAVTANFLNRHSEAEARVEEISGVAFIFNQKFFKDLYQVCTIYIFIFYSCPCFIIYELTTSVPMFCVLILLIYEFLLIFNFFLLTGYWHRFGEYSLLQG
jgi:hypothetical protein